MGKKGRNGEEKGERNHIDNIYDKCRWQGIPMSPQPREDDKPSIVKTSISVCVVMIAKRKKWNIWNTAEEKKIPKYPTGIYYKRW